MVLALRLFLTPLLIAIASLAGRRWGPAMSGWLIGFPLNSAPISLILALTYGPTFAAQAAVGTMAGITSICAFCLAYSVTAPSLSWVGSALAGAAVFFIVTFVWLSVPLALLPTLIIALISTTLVLRWIPSSPVPITTADLPSWDIPARMIIASAFVLGLTALTSVLGPELTGLLAPFPIFATVLAAFAHHQQGANAARQLLRGLALGLYGVAGFFLVVGSLLPTLGIVWTYGLATPIALTVSGLSLHLSRRSETLLLVES